MLRHLLSRFLELPLLLRVGIVIFYAGSMVDVLYHTALLGPLGVYLGQDGLLAHLVILLGMVVILLGVFARGIQVSFRNGPGSAAK